MSAARDFVRGAFDYLLGGPAVGGADEERLRRWLAMPAADLVAPHARTRYVVVATAAAARERPVAIAAVAVERLQIGFAGCFAASLDARTSPAERAMLDWLEFAGKSPLIAFDAPRERARAERSMKSLLGVPLPLPWIDLQPLLAALFRSQSRASFDDWARHFGAQAAIDDVPLADAWTCAQLALVVLDAATRAGAGNARALIDLAAGARGAGTM